MPTLLYTDSLNTYDLGEVRVRYTSSGLLQRVNVAGRYAGNGVLYFNSGFGESKVYRALPKLTGKIRIGFDLKFDTSVISATGPFADSMILGLIATSGTPVVTIRSNSSKQLELATYPSTVIDTTVGTLDWQIWYHLNLDVDFASNTLTVYVDGVEVLQATTSLASVTNFGFLHNSFGFKGHAFSNLYILDMDTGSQDPTTYRVDVAYPTSDALVSGWAKSFPVANYLLVDENGLIASSYPDADNLSSSTPLSVASFYLYTSAPGAAVGIQFSVGVESVVSGPTISMFIEYASTRYYTSSFTPSSSGYYAHSLQVYAVSPATSLPLTAEDFQTHAFGVRLETGSTSILLGQLLVEKVTAVSASAGCRYYAKIS